MKKRLDLVLNGKGGVGKSFFATNFVQFLKDRNIPHIAVDTDNENSTLKRFHPDVEFLDFRDEQNLDVMFESLEKSDLVVVDCRAASTEIFLGYFVEVGVFELLGQFDAGMTLVMPVNHESDSVEQIASAVEELGPRCQYVVVRNQALSSSFEIFDHSKTRARLLSDLGGMEMAMPRMYDWLVQALNKSNLTVTNALQHTEFSILDRQRLKNWQRTFYDQVDSVQKLILPALTIMPPESSIDEQNAPVSV
jgi:hypothetical protein